uniref:Activating signal cointegrator 1 complex subunit 2 n=1 Tax=Leptobrachium leishanense TaxID=445787 RepID=A0A8C5LWV1_9ANUR
MPVLPLDERCVDHKDAVSGKLQSVPALNPKRAQSRHFVVYLPPPASCSPALLEEFLERSEFIIQDLHWLLSLPHDLFWCQVIFDESLQKCLDSFLSNCPRRYDLHPPLPVAAQNAQREIHRCVFLTFLRMSTHKESKDHYITPCVFGEIIYNNYLFDIAKLMDICVLFGKGNSALLQKMIGNIFQHQPSYYQDLNDSVPTLLQVLCSILDVFGLQQDQDLVEPQKLEAQKRSTPLEMPVQELKDAVLYFCDSSSTLWAFLDIFPAASDTFRKHDFLSRLSNFYELCCPELENAIIKRKFEDKSMQTDLWRRLSHSRKKILETFHIILSNTCLQPILEHRAENIQPYIEDVLQVLTVLLPDRSDETRTSYILHGVQGAWADTRRPISHPAPVSEISPVRATEEAQANSHQNSHFAKEPECAGATGGPSLTGVELDSLVSQVKDLLPDLGDGFVLSCLEEYAYDPEKVINNLLEENLTPTLQALDRTLPRQQKPDPCPNVSSRSNVFADDEFDVFSRDVVDKSRIWKGRRKPETSTQLLADKSIISSQRERYSQYSMVTEEHVVDGDYEDEYDDTYDGNQVGANDADSDDELISRRPFTTPQVLRSRVRVAEDEEEEDEDAEEETVKPDHFVQDPAVLRERAEARRANFYARKGIRQDNTPAVTGASRGQGQSRETVQDRRKKEANKGARANHNRRNMADRKRNKGMIPS